MIVEISGKRLGATAVVDSQEQLVGIVTDGDLRRMLAESTLIFRTLGAQDIMTPSPKTIDKTQYAVDAFNVMTAFNITQLVATDNGKIAGFVHLHDLIQRRNRRIKCKKTIRM